MTQNMGIKPQNMHWGGFHGQHAPNTNIMTHPQFTLSARMSLCKVPPTILELRQGQQHSELLLARSAPYIVLRTLCQKCFSALVHASPAFV